MLQREVNKKYVNNYASRYYARIPEFSTYIKELNLPLKNAIVLDLACGPGQFAVIFDEYKPKKIICQDKWKEYLKEAKKRHKKHNIKTPITYTHEDMMKLPYKNQSIDIIFCNGAFFYAANEKKAIENFFKVLKPGGVVYIRTDHLGTLKKIPWYNPIRWISYIQYFFTRYIGEYKLFPVAAQSITKIKKQFTQQGFVVEKIVKEPYNFRLYARKAK